MKPEARMRSLRGRFFIQTAQSKSNPQGKLRLVVFGVVLLAAIGVTGCCTGNANLRQEHVLVIDNQGNPLLVDSNRCHRMTNYAGHLSSMANSMRRYADTDTNGDGSAKTNHELVVFIHGGNNSHAERIGRAARLPDAMKRDGVYPVFVCWDSGLFNSYWEHLVWVRRGNRDYKNLAPLEAPLYLVSDIGGAILKSPIVIAEGCWRAAEAIPNNHCQNKVLDCATNAAYELTKEYRNTNPVTRSNAIAIRVGGNHLTTWGKWKKSAKVVLGTPRRVLFSPFFHALGTPAWNVMLRRVDLMFEGEGDSHGGYGTNFPPQGALAVFAREIAQFIGHEKRRGHEWKVTLIGHSMGAIVATEFIARSNLRHQFSARGQHRAHGTSRESALVRAICNSLHDSQ
jgi:hypothetical protein